MAVSFRTPAPRADPSAVDLQLVATLDDPARAALFFHVTSCRADVSRDEAARAVGVSRRVAAFHLDRLVQDGLLESSFRRLSGKSGPGAGRPNKLYRRSERRIDVSLPRRNYELLARLLASAVQSAGGPARDRLRPGAEAFGMAIGEAARAHAAPGGRRQKVGEALKGELAGQGFEPFVDSDGTLRLRNCPYHEMAREDTELVCSMNLALMAGIAAGLGSDELEPVLEPRDGMCCVAFRRA